MMTAAESSSLAWTAAKFALPGHQVWERPFARWGLSYRPAGVKAVVGCHFDPDSVAEQVDEILRCFQDADEPANWTLGPSSTPIDLSKHLRRERRLMGPMFLIGMELDLVRWEPEKVSLTTELLRDLESISPDEHPTMTWFPKAQRADGLLMLRELVSRGAAFPFGSTIDGELASAMTLFVHEEIAGVYDVVTRPEFRNRGAATAVLTMALAFARERGCRVAALQSHKKAVGLYERMGFVETGIFKSMYYSKPRLAKDREARLL
ncbi:MAG: GNAT family N-acetyltransferase [Fimbriimonadaceae bacterium]|nr:GNAT family N-acetyltransferase [Fimbriimonadaceae bacterium]